MSSYHPTLWRTCRVLANERRLQCLRAVLRAPGASVGEIAALANLPQDQTSACLRTLQARGLLQAGRTSRWVHYHPFADPLVPAAAPILSGLSRALLQEKRPCSKIIRSLTAFTHPRRLTILRLLQKNKRLSFSALTRQSDISPAALARHLNKLQKREVIDESGGEWSLTAKPSQLTQLFFRLIATSPEI